MRCTPPQLSVSKAARDGEMPTAYLPSSGKLFVCLTGHREALIVGATENGRDGKGHSVSRVQVP